MDEPLNRLGWDTGSTGEPYRMPPQILDVEMAHTILKSTSRDEQRLANMLYGVPDDGVVSDGTGTGSWVHAVCRRGRPRPVEGRDYTVEGGIKFSLPKPAGRPAVARLATI